MNRIWIATRTRPAGRQHDRIDHRPRDYRRIVAFGYAVDRQRTSGNFLRLLFCPPRLDSCGYTLGQPNDTMRGGGIGFLTLLANRCLNLRRNHDDGTNRCVGRH